MKETRLANPYHHRARDPQTGGFAPETASVFVRLMLRTRLDAETGCWHWTGMKDPAGYGRFELPAGGRKPHRLMYAEMIGPIPEGLVIDHLCRNRGCINPSHLEVITQAENVKRGHLGQYRRAQTKCNNGHPFSGDNLYVSKAGKRMCIACDNERRRQNRARKKAAALALNADVLERHHNDGDSSSERENAQKDVSQYETPQHQCTVLDAEPSNCTESVPT